LHHAAPAAVPVAATAAVVVAALGWRIGHVAVLELNLLLRASGSMDGPDWKR
jgi:hypothetical protein